MLSTRVSWGEKWEGGVPIVQQVGEPVQAPGHDFIPLVQVAFILAASNHSLLSQTKAAALPPSGHRLG